MTVAALCGPPLLGAAFALPHPKHLRTLPEFTRCGRIIPNDAGIPSSAVLVSRAGAFGLRPLYCSWPRWLVFLPIAFGAAFALLQRRVGMRATHPSPPPSPHQSIKVPASKRALKALQRMLTTLNHQGVRLGSPSSGWGFPPSAPVGLWHPQGRGSQGLRPLYCSWPRSKSVESERGLSFAATTGG
jgi:hypothetical protein